MPSFPQNSAELNTILKNTKCVILKFSASWCGPCQNKDFLNEYHALKDEFIGNTEVLFLELDVDDDEELVNEFNITSVPTFKIFNSGKLLSEYTGAGNFEKMFIDIITITDDL